MLTILTVFVNPQVAFGAGSNASVSATYTALRDTDTARTFDRGISLGGTHRIYRWLFVAAEGAFSARHEDYSSSQGGTYDFYYQSFQAGPRASPRSGRVRPYAELLAGVTRLGIWERRLDRTGAWGSPEVSMQPGVGVDLLIAQHVALRLGSDVRVLFRHDNRFDRDYRTQLYRLNAGVAFHFGGS
jgi:hypothetical protein